MGKRPARRAFAKASVDENPITRAVSEADIKVSVEDTGRARVVWTWTNA